jgi:hypothetical protein
VEMLVGGLMEKGIIDKKGAKYRLRGIQGPE